MSNLALVKPRLQTPCLDCLCVGRNSSSVYFIMCMWIMCMFVLGFAHCSAESARRPIPGYFEVVCALTSTGQLFIGCISKNGTTVEQQQQSHTTWTHTATQSTHFASRVCACVRRSWSAGVLRATAFIRFRNVWNQTQHRSRTKTARMTINNNDDDNESRPT